VDSPDGRSNTLPVKRQNSYLGLYINIPGKEESKLLFFAYLGGTDFEGLLVCKDENKSYEADKELLFDNI
jgi:hypothetical protein